MTKGDKPTNWDKVKEVWAALEPGETLTTPEMGDLAGLKMGTTKKGGHTQIISSFLCLKVRAGFAAKAGKDEHNLVKYQKLADRIETPETPKREKAPRALSAVQIADSIFAKFGQFKAALAAKEKQIKTMAAELKAKDEEITHLREQIRAQSLKINTLNEKLSKGERSYSLHELNNFRDSLPAGTA